jgi:hypothetical protein
MVGDLVPAVPTANFDRGLNVHPGRTGRDRTTPSTGTGPAVCHGRWFTFRHPANVRTQRNVSAVQCRSEHTWASAWCPFTSNVARPADSGHRAGSVRWCAVACARMPVTVMLTPQGGRHDRSAGTTRR